PPLLARRGADRDRGAGPGAARRAREGHRAFPASARPCRSAFLVPRDRARVRAFLSRHGGFGGERSTTVIGPLWRAAISTRSAGKLIVLTYHRVTERLDPLFPEELDESGFEWQMRLVA